MISRCSYTTITGKGMVIIRWLFICLRNTSLPFVESTLISIWVKSLPEVRVVSAGAVGVPCAPYDQEIGGLVAQDRLIQGFLLGAGIRSSVMQSLTTVGAQPGCSAVQAAFVPSLPGVFFEPSCDPFRKLTFSQRIPFWLPIGRSSFCYVLPKSAHCSSKFMHSM